MIYVALPPFQLSRKHFKTLHVKHLPQAKLNEQNAVVSALSSFTRFDVALSFFLDDYSQ